MDRNIITKRAWLEIDLDRLSHNIGQLRSHLNKDCAIMAVVKANCYGQGAVPIARYLSEHEGVSHFAVACLSEAIELREAGIKCEILVLSYTAPSLVHELVKNDITQAVSSFEYADELDELCRKSNSRLKTHIKLDTGMTRTGFDCRDDEQIDSIVPVYGLKGLEITGTFSHFSSSDDGSDGAEEYCLMQIERFAAAVERLSAKGCDVGVRHICNTGGIQKYPQAHFDMVRCGAAMTGYNTACGITPWEIKPTTSLKAAVTCLRDIPKGTAISYSRTFVAEKPLRVAVLSIGYADGYPRGLSRIGRVMLHGRWARQLGNVCMDQMMIDVSDIPEARLGDAAVIIGEDGGLCQTADDIGAQYGSCMHEVMSRLSSRLQRIYYSGNKIVDIY